MTNWLNTLFGKPDASINITMDFPSICASLTPSIYSQLLPYEIDDKPLPDDMCLAITHTQTQDAQTTLPFSWSAGAREGIILYQRIGKSLGLDATDEENEYFAEQLYRAIHSAMLQADEENMAYLYQLLKQDTLTPMTYLPQLMVKISQDNSLISNNNYFELLLWIVTQSVTKNPIKIALALLTHFTDTASQRLLLLFALHPEFTFYSLLALQQRLSDQDLNKLLYPLGQRTKGWGRIQFVTFLSEPLPFEMRYWLITEGYKNNVMTEYVAYDCAVKADLLNLLNDNPHDLNLLLGCSDLLPALFNGGPANDIYDYAKGAALCHTFISQVENMPCEALKLLHCVCEINDFIQNSGEDWVTLSSLGWNDHLRQQMIAQSQAIIQKPEWATRIIAALHSDSRVENYQATLIANAIHLDIWDLLFSLQASDPNADWWHQLMQTHTTQKIESVVKLAEQQMALTQLRHADDVLIQSQSEYLPHHAVEYIMQDLGGFPGVGWSLIKRQLNSPMLRERNMALNVLSKWHDAFWNEECDAALAIMLIKETNLETHLRIQQLLSRHQDYE